MPFGQTWREKFVSDNVYDTILSPAISAAGAIPKRVDRDNETRSQPIVATIEQHLRSDDVVVADLTGNNSNVCFELGFCVANKRQFVCVAQEPGTASFWPGHFPIIGYSAPDAARQITDAVREAVAKANRGPASNADATLERISSAVVLLNSQDNPLIDRFIGWRLGRAHEQVNELLSGSWKFDVRSKSGYVAMMFSGIIDLLRPHEAYYTVTNPKFWSDSEVGATAFLMANQKAARVGEIKRLFLIDTADPDTQAVLERHLAASHAVAKADPGARMQIRCMWSHKARFEDPRYKHFAILSSAPSDTGDGCHSVVIEPHYAAGEFSHISLIFSRGESLSRSRETREWFANFSECFEAGTELADFLSANFKSSGRPAKGQTLGGRRGRPHGTIR